MSDTKKKVGRPQSVNPQDKRVTVRMNSQTFDKFEKYCKNNSVTKSEAIRRAIDLL